MQQVKLFFQLLEKEEMASLSQEDLDDMTGALGHEFPSVPLVFLQHVVAEGLVAHNVMVTD